MHYSEHAYLEKDRQVQWYKGDIMDGGNKWGATGLQVGADMFQNYIMTW